MKENRRLRWLTGIAICYMLFAFAWWTVLLLRKNEDARSARIELEKMRYESKSLNPKSDYLSNQLSTDIERKYDRQRSMIWMEGSFIFLGFLLGIFYILRVYNKDVSFANQRRNFLLSITHELKSPIASIQLILETFVKRQLEPQQFLKLNNSAIIEANRLHELVNNLLLSARLEVEYKPDAELISINQLLEEIITRLKVKYPNAILTFHATEIPHLKGERMGITSVFLNLIENAIKYSKTTPQVDIQAKYINDKFVINISDLGLGIPEKEKKKIFDKFYRVGSEETRHTKGTGLGLYIVNQIIKAHNGTIQVLDNLPQGTSFKVVLPD
jgi:signal transduction histidine kinase